MLDLELLQELVAFQKYGTLSAAAEHLMITQPTVTRKMKKLEQTLFNREVSNREFVDDDVESRCTWGWNTLVWRSISSIPWPRRSSLPLPT
ncbi:LysR family transcriptional regulator [Limosilactobacillus pontis]|uniref:LysR family transcriptional regulator n=1 Tax=Limosilactobacillus pontis TaxID=35787 RepID=A0ABU7SRY7_9LACO